MASVDLASQGIARPQGGDNSGNFYGRGGFVRLNSWARRRARDDGPFQPPASTRIDPLGADACVVDGPELAERVKALTGGAPVRLGLDAVSGQATARLSACVGEGGVVCNYGSMSGEDPVMSRAALVVAVDYDMCIPAEFAPRSSVFLTDDLAQFRASRAGPVFAGYPDPDASLGEALVGRAIDARPTGATYVNHLGVGLADVVFGDAIVRRAESLGIGTRLD